MNDLLTPDEYAKLKPRQQGYATYMQAEWPGSRIPKRCPYAKGTKERLDWERGQMDGVLEAQDCDD